MTQLAAVVFRRFCVTIDMSVGYAKAVREALPHAMLVIDRLYAEVPAMSVGVVAVGAVNASVRSA